METGKALSAPRTFHCCYPVEEGEQKEKSWLVKGDEEASAAAGGAPRTEDKRKAYTAACPFGVVYGTPPKELLLPNSFKVFSSQ